MTMRRVVGIGAALAAASVLFVTSGARPGVAGGFQDDTPQSWILGGQGIFLRSSARPSVAVRTT